MASEETSPGVSSVELQHLARETIGTKDRDRQHSLVFAQKQLIKELKIIEEHLEQLHEEISAIVAHSREGQILQSIPPVGPIQAATILSTIGNVANFEKASEFKSYCGWAPRWDQTGVSMDWMSLSKRGSRPLKHALYLMAARATALDCEWSRIYHRLLPRLCTYDERNKDFRGKKKAIGRIAGQMASLIFALLKTDQETLSKVPPGQEPPPPMLYDSAIHRKHQEGHYRPLKPGAQPRRITQLPRQS